MVDGTRDVVAMSAFVGSAQSYPHLRGLQPDLYRCFMEQTWRHQSSGGVSTLIHPDSHFTDEKAELLRRETYAGFVGTGTFINALKLFEVSDHVKYAVHVYGRRLESPKFVTAASLYHPDTVDSFLPARRIGSGAGHEGP